VTVSLQLYRFFFAGPPWVRRFQSRHAYQAMSRNLSNYVPKEREKIRTDPMVIASSFLNYGYEDLDANAPRPALRESDHPRRHSIQLYDHVVAGIPLEGKDVLEVSSGRGGGCRYIHETFGPRSVTGLDLSEASIEFSRLVNENADVQFRCGDAEAMPFADDSFDVVLNVEASHCYGSMDNFLSEVRRVLRPGGIFTWADARFREDVPALEAAVERSGLRPIRSLDITRNVLQALDVTTDDKLTTINQYVPRLLKPLVRSALAVRGTVVFNAFQNGDLVYLSKRAEKVRGE